MEWFIEVWLNIKALLAYWVAVIILLIPIVLFIKWQLGGIVKTISREIGVGAITAAQSIALGVGEAAYDTVKDAASGIANTAGDAASDIADTTGKAASDMAKTASDGVGVLDSVSSNVGRRAKQLFTRNKADSSEDSAGKMDEKD